MRKYLVGLLLGLQFCFSLVFLHAQSSNLAKLSFDDHGGFFFSPFQNQTESQLSYLNPSNPRPVSFFIRVNGYNQSPRMIKRSFTMSDGIRLSGPEFQTESISFKPVLYKHPQHDGLVGLKYEVRNESGASLIVSMSLILDTWFGEASGIHFRVTDENSNVSISTETTIIDSSISKLITSEHTERNSAFSLILPPDQSTYSLKATVSLANYEKLLRSPMQAIITEGTAFNLLPFSINDSAIHIHFSDIIIPAGEKLSRYLIITDKKSLQENIIESINTLFSIDLQADSGTPTINANSPNNDSNNESLNAINLDQILREIQQLQSRPSYTQAELERLLKKLQSVQR